MVAQGPVKEDPCPELGDGWTVLTYARKSVQNRSGGPLSASNTYKVYCAPDGSRFRSMVEARRAIEGPSCIACGNGDETPGNEIILCDAKGCKSAFHLACLEVPLDAVPEGDWYCPECVRRPDRHQSRRQRQQPQQEETGGGASSGGMDSWMIDTCGAPPIESYYDAGSYMADAGGSYGYEAESAPPSLSALAEAAGGGEGGGGGGGEGAGWYYSHDESAAPMAGYDMYKPGERAAERACEAPVGSVPAGAGWSDRSIHAAAEATPVSFQQALVTATAIAAAQAAAASPCKEVPLRQKLQSSFPEAQQL